MNLYFLVEGKETEPKIYRSWLGHLLPDLQEAQGFDEVCGKHYFLRAARHRSPSIEVRLKNSILEINQHGLYDYLVICIDAEDRTLEETKQGIEQILIEIDAHLNDGIKVELIIQDCCIETWLLGNRKIFARAPQSRELSEYIEYFNVCTDDPEMMTRPENDDRFGSDAQFHYEYLKALLAEKNTSYSKSFPRSAQEQYCLQQLQKRVQETSHLNSFRYFLTFCEVVKQNIES